MTDLERGIIEGLNRAARVLDPGKAPCDCVEYSDSRHAHPACDCGNHDDNSRISSWCERYNNQQTIKEISFGIESAVDLVDEMKLEE